MKTSHASAICAGVLLIAALYFASSVVVPFIIALFCAMLLDPPVMTLERKGFSRVASSSVVILAFLTVTCLTGWATYRTFSRAAEQAPQYLEKYDEIQAVFSKKTDDIIHQKRLFGDESVQRVEVVDGLSSWRSFLFRFIGSAFSLISLGFFVPLLIFYFLVGKENLVESFNTLVGRYCYLPKTNTEIPKMVQTFFQGNILAGLTLAVLHFALFKSMGLSNSAGLALASAPLSLIPILGVPLTVVLPLAQAVVQWNISDLFPFIVLVVSLVIFHVLVGNILIPQLVGSRINVNPVTMITGLLFWGWLWGAMGFLLAIPITAAIKIALESNEKTYSLSNIMAARPRHVIPFKVRHNPPDSPTRVVS